MSWSAMEIKALAHKAARGAGAPPEQAARFGLVAAVHLMASRSVAQLNGALDALPGGPILTYPLALDECLSRAAECTNVDLTGIEPNELLLSYVEVMPFATKMDASETGAARLSIDLTAPRVKTSPKRILGCEAFIMRLSELAERTFVPESAQSRAAGAGAGLTDND